MKNKILASMREEASEFMKDPKKKMREWWDKWWEFMKDPKKKMREWWDKWWEFMKDSKKEMRECWENFKFKNPWWACSLQYFSLFLFVLLVGHIVSGILSNMADVDYFRYPLSETFRHPFNLSANLTINRTIMQQTETYAAEMYADNARSILCTLVASEAAIVAIVVSLTLIAIELTASAYSPRVIKISLKNPDMWLLLLIYGVAIFASIILIKELPYESRFPTEDVSFAFWFGVFSYAALVPYLLNIIQFLHPTNIVRRLSEEIADDDILEYINGQEKTSKGGETVEDPIQRILDIIYRSINNYDLETVREGLEVILKHAKTVINSSKEKEKSISKYFCNQLKRIGRLAASKDDEGSTKEVIKNLQSFGVYTENAGLIAATKQVVETLGDVGKISAGKGKAFEDAVTEIAKSLKELGKILSEEEVLEKIASEIGTVGVEAVVNNLDTATLRVIKCLKEFCENFCLDKKKATYNTFKSLEDVGKNAKNTKLAKEKLNEVLKQAAYAVFNIWEKKKQDYAVRAIKSLRIFKEIAEAKQLDSKKQIDAYMRILEQ